MNWPEIKEYLIEPIISKQKDPLLIFPLAVLTVWSGQWSTEAATSRILSICCG